MVQELSESANGTFAPDAPAHRLGIVSVPKERSTYTSRDWAFAYANPNLTIVPGTPYSANIAHIQKTSLDASLRPWSDQLEGATACRLTQLTDGLAPTAQRRIRYYHTDVDSRTRPKALAKQLNISMASIFQLTWALVLRSYTNLQDICFGRVCSERDIELDGITDAVGPFINTLISCIVFGRGDKAAAMLKQLFSTYLDSLPHQHASLTDITHTLKMPGGKLFNAAFSFFKISQSNGSAKAQGLPLSFRSIGGADPTESLFWALGAIQVTPSYAIKILDLVPAHHIDQLKSWVNRLPPIVDRRVHDLFEDVVRSTPIAPAIHAWDGDLTYAELDRDSSRLAGLHLRQSAKPDTFIAVCFEKSAWAAIAYLTIIKAGTALMQKRP
ncbi:uncharacterized protein FPRO_15956 [Fusarium proliferatum ET1]|uniref:Condensation domain-containing protein n=1 Tax=Fusarium proliferatum (strain ET1) TaxID=1227346 RepID=A0A1L7WAE8_FUSPR|nr:uncharacterized protein FPRO_15956 [Fusarium proliferatum ET1]CZR49598.1 uncharacterized protein FPRO_15956 [Fusarium proliferatum ET1]